MTSKTTLPPHVAEVAAQALSTQEKFDALRAVNRSRNSKIEDAADRFVEGLKSTFNPDALPQVGEPFPNFVMPNQSGDLVARDHILQGRPTVVSFNRGHWCFYCMLELSLLQRIVPQLDAMDCGVVSIVPETTAFAGITKDRCNIDFPVLSDMDSGLGANLGLLVVLTEELREHYYNREDDIGRFQDNHGWFLPVPATFIVDGDGIVRAKFADPEYRMRMGPEDVIKCIEKLR